MTPVFVKVCSYLRHHVCHSYTTAFLAFMYEFSLLHNPDIIFEKSYPLNNLKNRKKIKVKIIITIIMMIKRKKEKGKRMEILFTYLAEALQILQAAPSCIINVK